MNRQKGKVGMLEMTSETRNVSISKNWDIMNLGERNIWNAADIHYQNATLADHKMSRTSPAILTLGTEHRLNSIPAITSLKKREWKQRSGKEGENWLPIKTDTLTEFWRRWMQ